MSYDDSAEDVEIAQDIAVALRRQGEDFLHGEYRVHAHESGGGQALIEINAKDGSHGFQMVVRKWIRTGVQE